MSQSSEWRMPAEWEPHEATWLSWPNVRSYSFPFNMEQVRPAFLEIIRALAGGEEIWINVNEPDETRWITERLNSKITDRIRFFEINTNEPWCRDHGPTFVVNDEGQRSAVTWKYNSWGGKYPPYIADAAAGGQMANEIETPPITTTLVMEGGAIDSNGAGDILTSRSCLLDPARNPDLSENNVSQIFKEKLGAKQTLWLTGTTIHGDDTDGHVDMTTRFTAPNRVLTTLPSNRNSADFATLSDNLKDLEKMRTHTGQALEIETLPILPPFYNSGFWAPRVYANFYIGNESVIVPAYQAPEDDIACEILARHFPTRTIIPINCSEIIKGHGALHCLTQQVPLLR